MRQGLVEWALLTGALVIAAVIAIAVFGDEIRGALGIRPGTSGVTSARLAAP